MIVDADGSLHSVGAANAHVCFHRRFFELITTAQSDSIPPDWTQVRLEVPPDDRPRLVALMSRRSPISPGDSAASRDCIGSSSAARTRLRWHADSIESASGPAASR